MSAEDKARRSIGAKRNPASAEAILEAAKTVTEGLVRAIAEEVASKRASGAGYGPGATATAADTRAITLNQRA